MSGDLEIVGFGGRVGRSDMLPFTHPDAGEGVHAIPEKVPAGHRLPEPRMDASTWTRIPVPLRDSSLAHPILESLPAPSPRHRHRGSAPGEPFEGQDTLSIGSPSFPSSPSSGLADVLRGVRVLVVDDEEDTVDLFAAALTACGAEVVTATSAPEALGLVTLRSPAVVVSDIAMPGTDGYWVVHEIRQLTDERLRTIPVIAVTAFGRNHVRPESLAAGFVDHLEKPVDPAALCSAVARARIR